MKKVFGAAVAVALACATGAASARDYGYSRYDNQYTRYDNGYRCDGRNRNSSAPVLGALIGGAIGNQFGHGDRRAVTTVAGAALGYAVGDSSRRCGNNYGYSGRRHVSRAYNDYGYSPYGYGNYDNYGYGNYGHGNYGYDNYGYDNYGYDNDGYDNYSGYNRGVVAIRIGGGGYGYGYGNGYSRRYDHHRDDRWDRDDRWNDHRRDDDRYEHHRHW